MLWENKLRFLFSILGIGISIALIFINQGFQDGMLRQIKAYLLGTGADIFISQEGVDSFLFSSSALPFAAKADFLRVSGVEQVTDVVAGLAMFDYQNDKTPVMVIGFDPNKDVGGPWQLKQGQPLEPVPLYQKTIAAGTATGLLKKQIKPKEAIFDYALSKKYGLEVGDDVEIQDYDFKIVGLSGGTTSWITSPIFMSRESARNIFKKSADVTSFFLINVKDGYDVQAVKDQIALRSADYSKISKRVSGIEVFTASELAQKDADFTEELFISMMGIITLLTFLIGVLIIGMVIYILTLEKLRDFAVLKAVGTTNGQIYKTVIIQTFISAFLGFILGLLIALGLEYLTTQVITTQFTIVVEPGYIWTVLVASVVMALLASYVPIRKVFKVEPTLVFSARKY